MAVIEFGEFVRSLGVFHPNSPPEDKVAFAFRLYDLRRTGDIEREELQEMVLALLHESELDLSGDIVESIVDKTFNEADTQGDGKIDQEEWKAFVSKNPSLIKNMNPSLIKNMTLPYLMDMTLAFPSFLVSERLMTRWSFKLKAAKSQTVRNVTILKDDKLIIPETSPINIPRICA